LKRLIIYFTGYFSMSENYNSYQSRTGGQRRYESATGPNSTNNRSRPEYQVTSSINSKRRESRSSPQRKPSREANYDGYQQRSLKQQRQEEVPPPPKEYERMANDRSSYNNSPQTRPGHLFQSGENRRKNQSSDKWSHGGVWRSDDVREETHQLPRENEDSTWSSPNDRQRLPGRTATYEPSYEKPQDEGYPQTPPRDGKVRRSKGHGSFRKTIHEHQSPESDNTFKEAGDGMDPEVRNTPTKSPWKDSYSTMQSVPVPARYSRERDSRGRSHRRTSSGSTHSKGIIGERKQLKAPKSNPYASKRTKSFLDIKIPPIFIRALTDMNFVQPTQIQAHALPLILDSQRPSVMGHAKAGSGKTAAFGIGMLYWSSTQNDRCEALAICPTRELAIQVHEVVVSLAKFTQHGVFLAVPGCDNRSRISDAVVIGTPGKIYYDLLGGEQLRRKDQQSSSRYPKRPLIDAKHVRLLVIDEADHLLNKQGGLSDIVMKCRQMLPQELQVLCFSATFDSQAREFVNVVAPGATLVEVQPSKQEQQAGKRIPGGINSLKIKHIMAKCNGDQQKYECLSDMFGYFNIGQSLIFVQTTDNANSLSKQLSEEGYQVGIIHGKMPKQLRDAVMEDFRAGKSTHLISSNLLARGIDIPNISVVINYDVPIGKHVDQYGRTSWDPDAEIYVHRAGRAGRFGRNGACITLIHDLNAFEKFSLITNRLEKDYGLTVKQVDAESLETIEEEVNSHLAS